MDTASLEFVAFGLTVAVLSNLSTSMLWRAGVLSVASVVMIGLLLGNASWISLVPFAIFLAVGFAGIKLVERGWHRALVISIIIVVTAYVWLKKYTFIPEPLLLPFSYFTLGLSYIFFRVLSLLTVQTDPGSRACVSPGSYLIYMLNFTTLVSGPIQSYKDFAKDQFTSQPIDLDAHTVGLQVERIIRGFFKVNVLAMLLQAFQQDSFRALTLQNAAPQKSIAVFSLILVYPLFLYANFSGYIDIVIGLARLVRLRLPENFNRPFSASSFLEFWNRWHITLSQWLKTHVYNPLLIALMRRVTSTSLEPVIGVFCFFITFFLIGIWHGRSSEFAMFGLLQGGGVALNKIWQLSLARFMGRKRYRHLSQNAVYIIFARGLTFSYFAFSLFLFWADWMQLERIWRAVSGEAWIMIWIAVWAFASVMLAGWERLRAALLSISFQGSPLFSGRYAMVVYGSVLGFFALITVVLDQPAPDVVYKAF